MSDMIRTQEEITISGNPRHPEGEDGSKMLLRMNESHTPVTGWALGFWTVNETDTVLDIGCGGGAALKRIATQVTTGHLTGVDYSPVSVAPARETNSDAINTHKMDILEASVEQLPFADDTFDKIITVESFYFWPSPQKNLKEVLRVLKNSGTFLLVADVYQKEGLSDKTLENIRNFHLFNPTPEEFRTLFEQAGFSDIQIHLKDGKDWICVEGHKASGSR